MRILRLVKKQGVSRFGPKQNWRLLFIPLQPIFSHMKYLFLAASALVLFSCGSTKKTASTDEKTQTEQVPAPQTPAPPTNTGDLKPGPGARYTLNYDAPGPNAKLGDILLIKVANYNQNDSLLFSSFNGMDPVPLEVTAPEFHGDLMDAIVHASKGDSITVLIPVDSLTDFQPVPGLVEMGQDIKLVIKVMDLMSKPDYEAFLKKSEKEQQAKDAKIIEDYLKSKNIKASKTASGLYYVIDKKGTGPNAQNGQTVSVDYIGTLINGKQFDSSRKPGGQPYTFKLGQSPVIQGWQEGIPLLNKGAKAHLFIPSHLGYGIQGAGADIPPNAVLIFDVELVDIK